MPPDAIEASDFYRNAMAQRAAWREHMRRRGLALDDGDENEAPRRESETPAAPLPPATRLAMETIRNRVSAAQVLQEAGRAELERIRNRVLVDVISARVNAAADRRMREVRHGRP